MATIGELLVEIKATKEQFDKTLKDSGNSLYKFADTAEKVGQKVTSIGVKMSIGVTAPLALIGKKSLDAAMAAVESENLFEVSMGDMAKSARKWSEDISDSLGLNEYAVRQNVGTFNVMFDSMGIGKEKALDMSEGLTQLSYDMASFYNLKPEEAFQKLQAGITGEIEPLKRLGIVINETTVKAYAYKTGIAEVGAELTEQEKLQARYALIMEQTSKAQGDLARTLDSPTNKLRIFKEQVTQASIELGNALIPMFSKALDIAEPFIEKFKNLTDEQKENIVKWGLIAAAAGPALMILGKGIQTVSSLAKAYQVLSTAQNGAALSAAGVAIPVAAAAVTYKTLGDKIRDAQTSSEKINWAFLMPPAEVFQGIRDIIALYKGWKEDLFYFGEAFKTQNPLMGGITKLYNEHTDALNKQKEATNDSAISTSALTDEMFQLKAGHLGAKDAAEENTGAIDEQKQSVDELIASLNNLFNLNQSVTEATWDYEDSLAELDKVMKDANSTEREKEAAVFATQDALESLQIAMLKEYQDTETSIDQKEKLRNKYIETGLEAVSSGAMSEEAFMKMASEFGLTTAQIIQFAEEMGIKLDEETQARIIEIKVNLEDAEFYSRVNAVRRTINELGTGYMAGLGVTTSGKVRDSGGYARETNFVKDLGVFEINGEAFLPKELTNAIKTMRSDFSGIMPTRSLSGASQAGQVVNQYITINKEIDESRIGNIIAKYLSW